MPSVRYGTSAASPATNAMDFVWDLPRNADGSLYQATGGYTLYWAAGGVTNSAPFSTTSGCATGLVAKVRYCFYVTVRDTNGCEGAASNVIWDTVPGPPTWNGTLAITRIGPKVQLSWWSPTPLELQSCTKLGARWYPCTAVQVTNQTYRYTTVPSGTRFFRLVAP